MYLVMGCTVYTVFWPVLLIKDELMKSGQAYIHGKGWALMTGLITGPNWAWIAGLSCQLMSRQLRSDILYTVQWEGTPERDSVMRFFICHASNPSRPLIHTYVHAYLHMVLILPKYYCMWKKLYGVINTTESDSVVSLAPRS